LLLCSSYLPLGVPNWAVIYIPSSNFSGVVAGEKEDLCIGSLSLPIFYFVILLIYFIFACIFLSKIQKISSFIVVIFTCLLLSLARMSNPEVEVHTFKQQGGESLKDDWYRISNAHHRCTKKHSTMILLRNFYVGISSWNRYVLDTLAGGNFLGTPALEACTLIKSLVGVQPINVVKAEITLEEVLEKLSSLEFFLPNILDNASQVNELIESIGKESLF
jgi:hypothetical protein